MLHPSQGCRTSVDSHFPHYFRWVLSQALTASGSTEIERGLLDVFGFIAQFIAEAADNKIVMRCCCIDGLLFRRGLN